MSPLEAFAAIVEICVQLADVLHPQFAVRRAEVPEADDRLSATLTSGLPTAAAVRHGSRLARVEPVFDSSWGSRAASAGWARTRLGHRRPYTAGASRIRPDMIEPLSAGRTGV